MKTHRKYLNRLIALVALPLVLATGANAAVNVYFSENFNSYTVGSTGAALASTNLVATGGHGASGGVKVFDDFGGSGTTPSTTMFGDGERFLNVNRDLVATTNAFNGGYVITSNVSFIDGWQSPLGNATFDASSTTSIIALQVMLRMSSSTAYDGLVLRFTVGGTVTLYSSNGSAGTGFTTLGSISGFPNLNNSPVSLKIVDTGSDISIYANNSIIGTFSSISYGASNAGYLALGQSGQYLGTKFNDISVSAISIPEPKTAGIAMGMVMICAALCIRKQNRTV